MLLDTFVCLTRNLSGSCTIFARKYFFTNAPVSHMHTCRVRVHPLIAESLKTYSAAVFYNYFIHLLISVIQWFTVFRLFAFSV